MFSPPTEAGGANAETPHPLHPPGGNKQTINPNQPAPSPPPNPSPVITSTYANMVRSSVPLDDTARQLLSAEYRKFNHDNNVVLASLPQQVSKRQLISRLLELQIKFTGIGDGPGQNTKEILLPNSAEVQKLMQMTNKLEFDIGKVILDDCREFILHHCILRNVPIGAKHTNIEVALKEMSHSELKITRCEQRFTDYDGIKVANGTWVVSYSNCTNWINKVIIGGRIIEAYKPNTCFNCGMVGHIAKSPICTRNKRYRENEALSKIDGNEQFVDQQRNPPAEGSKRHNHDRSPSRGRKRQAEHNTIESHLVKMDTVSRVDEDDSDQKEPAKQFDRNLFLDSLSVEEIKNTPIHPLHQELLHYIFADNKDVDDPETWVIYFDNWLEYISTNMTDEELASLADACSSLHKD